MIPPGLKALHLYACWSVIGKGGHSGLTLLKSRGGQEVKTPLLITEVTGRLLEVPGLNFGSEICYPKVHGFPQYFQAKYWGGTLKWVSSTSTSFPFSPQFDST